ncbi:MAG TPA: SCP2 sterol-binding domain-containing protein [Ktedonobacteraceae bacterium]|jgi:putative sterol carrier protein|nr:SCP2 sterol-binding domain-containing protein [Ktedonobacteraceae bacterium]
MADIRPYLERVRERFSDPKLQDSFKTLTMLFEFPDTQQNFALAMIEGNVTLEERNAENPDVRVTISTDMLAGIMDHKVNPITAYMTRKLKVQGAQQNLVKLQKLLL